MMHLMAWSVLTCCLIRGFHGILLRGRKTLDGLGGAEKDGTPVEQGTGPNVASYFVCTELASGPFTRLPDVRPGHIKVARRLKRFLTGRLDSQVCLATVRAASQDGSIYVAEGFSDPSAIYQQLPATSTGTSQTINF